MDQSEFQNLVDLHYKDLFRFAYSLSRNPDDASDLTQQTFAIFAEKGGDLRDPSKCKSWLFTTLYREFLRLSTSAKRMVSMEESELEATLSTTQESPDAQRTVEQHEVLEVLNELDEGYRSILSLFYLNQHSYKEIAEILHTPIGTVMSRLSRAKEALRARLQKRNWGE